jgi:hypothetical protein
MTAPNAGWLMAYYRDELPGIQIIGSDILEVRMMDHDDSRRAWGYCLWSNARLKSTRLFDKVQSCTRKGGCTLSTYLADKGKTVPQEW